MIHFLPLEMALSKQGTWIWHECIDAQKLTHLQFSVRQYMQNLLSNLWHILKHLPFTMDIHWANDEVPTEILTINGGISINSCFHVHQNKALSDDPLLANPLDKTLCFGKVKNIYYMFFQKRCHCHMRFWWNLPLYLHDSLCEIHREWQKDYVLYLNKNRVDMKAFL